MTKEEGEKRQEALETLGLREFGTFGPGPHEPSIAGRQISKGSVRLPVNVYENPYGSGFIANYAHLVGTALKIRGAYIDLEEQITHLIRRSPHHRLVDKDGNIYHCYKVGKIDRGPHDG